MDPDIASTDDAGMPAPSPVAVPPPLPWEVSWYPRIKNAILLCLGALGVQFGFGFVVGALQIEWKDGPWALVLYLGSVVSMVVVLSVGRRKNTRALARNASGRLGNAAAWAVVLVLPFGFCVLNSFLAELLMEVFPVARSINSEMFGTSDEGGLAWGPFIVFCCFLIPVFEELFFRGFLIGGLAGKYGQAKAVLVTTVLFALIHLNPTQVVSAFILGLVLGVLVVKTCNVGFCIVFHMLYNSLVFFLPLLLEAGLARDRKSFFVLGTYSFDYLDVVALGCLVVGGLLLARLPQEKQVEEVASADVAATDDPTIGP